ncbi:LCP family protein [Rhodococcus sp. F64268]|uniref:LCP family protein n=1 Tax=unclassified Rhodococcus (in: high G+C Gram-positive bacteria) TaxID=192944 RepID=UPI001FF390B0|nr:LCP family protein [Rhodococcus sp. F64268]MCK0091312.1 LCP family protein [Rhodococcus sp. F64268]
MIRRNPPAPPRAWSQAPGSERRAAPPPPRRQPPPRQQPPPRRQPPPPQQHRPQQQHQRRQQPEPFVDKRRAATAPPPPPPAPPRRRRPPVAEPEPRRRRPGGVRRTLRRVGALLAVLLIAAVAGVVYFDGKLDRIDALADYEGRIGDTPGTNFLLVGSDSRIGLTPEQEQELATGGDVGPDRTDTIMLVHVPSGGGATTMVSLPRDSYVSVPGFGQDKLNASFALGGPQLLVQTVEGATGIHIDHYTEIGFSGFASIVDAVGGVDICVPYPIDDPLAGLQLEAGCQELNGAQSLGFVRTRATPLADLDRMNNQRLFMSALLSKATGPSTFLNPFRLWPLVSGAAASVRVDDGDHLWDLGRLAWAMRGETVTATVPVGGFEDVYGVGNVLLWDRERAIEFFGALEQDEQIPADLLAPAP